MHYFGMNSLSDVPSQNYPSQAISKSNKWSVLKHRIACIIDRYVVVDQLEKMNDASTSSNTSDANPHVTRIQFEHSYVAPLCVFVKNYSGVELSILMEELEGTFHQICLWNT